MNKPDNIIYSRGIRGAITVDDNTIEDIKAATVELLNAMIKENEVDLSEIGFVIFTLTDDLNKAFPAKFAREELNFNSIPMMCYNELEVEGSIKMCLRVLLNVNTTKTQDEIKHIYLKGATALRKDLAK